MAADAQLITIRTQARRLVDLGVDRLAGLDTEEFLDAARSLPGDDPAAVLVVHHAWVPPSALTPLLDRDGRPGFVVEDMTDLDDFTPIEGLILPTGPLYLLHDVDRGDDLRNLTPDEALPQILQHGRSPLTVAEGICWLLQRPGQLAPDHCFMTIGSRRPKVSRRATRAGLDARTPAIWISGGTGRDGRARRGAPKVGWCWAGNRHTWLGFASTTRRS